jgi:1-acyl-sn-glycerol-3-phosphate acyltransferase
MRLVITFARVTLAGLAFLSFWVGAFVVVAFAFPLARWRTRRAAAIDRAAACQRAMQRAFTLLHDYMRVTGLLHFDPRRVDAATPGSKFVMIANHPTLVDVAAISAVYGRIACVAKTPLFHTPILGRALRQIAYLDSGSGDVFSGAMMVGQAMDRLAQSMPVLVFPEGTRSPPDGLRPFQRGAFEIACRANVPILPLVIRCTPPALGKGRPWYDIPDRTVSFTVTPLPALRPGDWRGDAGAMASACEEMYRQLLGLQPGAVSPTNISHPIAMS